MQRISALTYLDKREIRNIVYKTIIVNIKIMQIAVNNGSIAMHYKWIIYATLRGDHCSAWRSIQTYKVDDV